MKFQASLVMALALIASAGKAQTTWPDQRSTDYTIRDFHFADGEILPELRLHYITLGTPSPPITQIQPASLTGLT